MTAIALSVAAVVVAFVARDVALRALADKARERGRERADAKAIASLGGEVTYLGKNLDAVKERLGEVAEKVERLDGKDQMAAAMGRKR